MIGYDRTSLICALKEAAPDIVKMEAHASSHPVRGVPLDDISTKTRLCYAACGISATESLLMTLARPGT